MDERERERERERTMREKKVYSERVKILAGDFK